MSSFSYANTPPPYTWAPTSVSRLLKSDATGIAADFTQTDASKRVRINTAGVPVDSSANNVIVNASSNGYPARVHNSSGNWIWIDHNLFRNSETIGASGTITTVVGQNYTVGVIAGAGTLALSGAGSGTVSLGAPVTFTATTTSLAWTKTGTVTKAQCNRGATLTEYLAATTTDAHGAPVSYEDGEFVLLVEPQRTNSLLNSTVPVTQSVSLAAGTYALWVEGAGSCALSGGPTGTATDGAPVSFTLGGTTSVTFTITGSLDFFQCELAANTDQISSQIITYGAAVTRFASNLKFATSVFGGGTNFSMYCDYDAPYVTTTRYILTLSNGSDDYFGLRHSASSEVGAYAADGYAFQFNNNRPAVSVGAAVEWSGRFKANYFASSVDGLPITLGYQDVSGTMPVVTTCYIGSLLGNAGHPDGPLRIRRFCIVPRAVNSADLPSWCYDHTTDATAYDVFLVAGQSNTLNGLAIDVAIDVTNANIDAINQTGAVALASEPLPNVSPVAGRVGFPLAFARDFYAPTDLVSGRKVLIVPTGIGATGMDRWGFEKDLYNNAASLTGYVLAKYPNARLKGILWMQGETDALVPTSEVTHAANLDGTLNGFRAELGNVPIVVGGMVPEWVAAGAARQPVQDAIEDTVNRLSNVGYADPSTPTVIPGKVGDTVHYDAAGQRGTLGSPGGMAERFYTAFSALS